VRLHVNHATPGNLEKQPLFTIKTVFTKDIFTRHRLSLLAHDESHLVKSQGDGRKRALLDKLTDQKRQIKGHHPGGLT
jgi:hypothetical protein